MLTGPSIKSLFQYKEAARSHSGVKLLITEYKIFSEMCFISGAEKKKHKRKKIKLTTSYSISENDLYIILYEWCDCLHSAVGKPESPISLPVSKE